MSILHHDMFNGTCKEIDILAAAVELLVLSFHIFDDNDNEEPPWMENRDKSTNIATGFVFAVLSRLQFITAPQKTKIIEMYHKRALDAINGQHVDLMNTVCSILK